MKKQLITIIAAVLFVSLAEAKPDKNNSENSCVNMSTSKGDIGLLLNAKKAPISVQNFLDYVNAGYYNGTVFHRVIGDFMIQGGGFNANLLKQQTRKSITNEADNGFKNTRGTIAMARTSAPHSASSQFFYQS